MPPSPAVRSTWKRSIDVLLPGATQLPTCVFLYLLKACGSTFRLWTGKVAGAVASIADSQTLADELQGDSQPVGRNAMSRAFHDMTIGWKTRGSQRIAGGRHI